jgi:hypothetical protein
MTPASEPPVPETSAAFTDTSVLFDYGIDDDEAAQRLFREATAVEKVTSKRGQQEFESVCTNRAAIHESLQSYIPGELEEFEPDELDQLTGNDWDYLIHLFNELLTVEDNAEALRRLNEAKRKLQTAQRELFRDPDPFVTVVEVGPIDIRLRDQLATEIDNMDDVRLLCDVVEWTRDDGTGTFLTSDYTDFLEDDPAWASESASTSEDEANDEAGELSATLEEFTEGDDRTHLERLNEHIGRRYSEEAQVVILSTEAFLEHV